MARRLEIVLRISRIKNDDGVNYPVFSAPSEKQKELSKKVDSIIRDSLTWLQVFVGVETDERNFSVEQVKIRYDIQDKHRQHAIVEAVVPARFSGVSAAAIRTAVNQIYADDAADTWMEGDIGLDDDRSELFLKAKKMSLHRQIQTAKKKPPQKNSSKESDWSAYCEKQEKKFIKFWRVSVFGATWKVEWGKQGTTKPQSATHYETSPEVAMKKAEKLLHQKIRGGYNLLDSDWSAQ